MLQGLERPFEKEVSALPAPDQNADRSGPVQDQEEEEAFHQRYLTLLKTVEGIVAQHEQEMAVAKATGSPATVLNTLVSQTFALADAIDRMSDVGARDFLVEALKMVSEASAEAIERPNSKRGRRIRAKRLRLEVVAAAYEQRLIASEVLGRADLPARPGIESAYAIAAQIGCGLPHVSVDAIEQLRFRIAREAEADERGRYARFHSETCTFTDTSGPVLDLLENLPKKRGRPKSCTN